MTADPLEAAVQAHAEAEGFISPADDAWPAMRAAIRAWLEAQVGCDCADGIRIEAGRTHPCDRFAIRTWLEAQVGCDCADGIHPNGHTNYNTGEPCNCNAPISGSDPHGAFIEAGRTHPCGRCVVVEVGGVTLRVQTPYLTTFYIDIQDRVVFLPESRVLEADDDH